MPVRGRHRHARPGRDQIAEATIRGIPLYDGDAIS